MSGRILGEYIELTKPRITCFILMSTAIGFLCAEHLVGSFSWLVLFHTLLGTALLASGTAALNQWYERDADAKMPRTRNRPIPSGRVTPQDAFEFGLMLSIVGFLELWCGANLLTGLLGAFTEVSYLLLYTPLKQKSPHFYAIAWMYRDDYAKAGILMLPVVEPSNESTARRIVWFSLVLIPISLL